VKIKKAEGEVSLKQLTKPTDVARALTFFVLKDQD
jgi:hypothetical protein